jgi:hypothetical protein
MMEELYCIQEFQEAVDQLNFDTGDERFSNFSQVLRGAAEHNWDLVISNVQNCTPAIFIAALEQWKSEMILPTAWQTLVDSFETLVKPCSMTVEGFVNWLKVMVRYINNIPFPGQDPPTVNQTKLKNIIFRAMPTAWQTNFLRVNNVATALVLQIQKFMSQEHEFKEQSQIWYTDARNSRRPGKQTAHHFSGRFGGSNGRNKGQNNNENSSGTCRPWNSNNSNYENKYRITWYSLSHT